MRWQLLVTALLLAGCTTSNRSFVMPALANEDRARLVADSVWYLERPLPPASTTLLMPAGDDLLLEQLADSLRQAGYGVREAGADADGSLPLLVAVTSLEDGVLLRLDWQQGRAARFYPRAASGTLLQNRPFTVEARQ